MNVNQTYCGDHFTIYKVLNHYLQVHLKLTSCYMPIITQFKKYKKEKTKKTCTHTMKCWRMKKRDNSKSLMYALEMQ